MCIKQLNVTSFSKSDLFLHLSCCTELKLGDYIKRSKSKELITSGIRIQLGAAGNAKFLRTRKFLSTFMAKDLAFGVRNIRCICS
jgi:hypothetical protein